MTKSDSEVVRFAVMDDIPRIKQYIHREWRADHVLYRDDVFFNYQHVNAGKVSFVLGCDSENNILGILGYINSSLANVSVLEDVWLAMWKVSKDACNPYLGLRLLEFLRSKLTGSMFCLGIGFDTVPIYQYLRIKTGRMDHLFLLNPALKEFTIATVGEECAPNPEIKLKISDARAVELTEKVLVEKFSSKLCSNRKPKKDIEYLIWRYFKHPIYTYRCIGFIVNESLEAIAVTRIAGYANRSCVRVVDFIGDLDLLPNAMLYLRDEIVSTSHEFIDCLSFGIKSDVAVRAGLRRVDFDDDRIVIPNYLNPLLQKNVPVYFCADVLDLDDVVMFRADGDQDRPV